MREEDAERLIAGLQRWAEAESHCRALALAGSWARGTARPDSDLDLIALTSGPGFAGRSEWLRSLVEALGFSVASVTGETWGVAHSWRVMAKGGVELELTLADVGWARMPLDAGTRRVAADGLRPLVDKDGLLAAVKAAVAG